MRLARLKINRVHREIFLTVKIFHTMKVITKIGLRPKQFLIRSDKTMPISPRSRPRFQLGSNRYRCVRHISKYFHSSVICNIRVSTLEIQCGILNYFIILFSS